MHTKNVANEKNSNKEIFALDWFPSDGLQARCLTITRKQDFFGENGSIRRNSYENFYGWN